MYAIDEGEFLGLMRQRGLLSDRQYHRDTAMYCTGLVLLSGVASPSRFDMSRCVQDASASKSQGEIGSPLAKSGFVTVDEAEIHDMASEDIHHYTTIHLPPTH